MGKRIISACKVLILAYVITALLLLLSAFMMYKIGIGDSTMRAFVMAIYGIATFVAGLCYVKIRKNRRIVNGALMGAVYFAILMMVSFIVNHELFQDGRKAAISCTVCIACGIMGGMVG